MRLALATILTVLSFSAFADDAGRSFPINTPLPSNSTITVDTDLRPAASPANAVTAAAVPGGTVLPTVPASVSASPQAPATTEAPASNVAPALVPGAPAKVYPNLGAAAADGVNPVARSSPVPTAQPTGNPIDAAAKYVIAHIEELGLLTLAVVSMGTLISIVRRRRNKKDE